MIFNNLSDILNYLPTVTLHSTNRFLEKPAVFNHYKMNIRDQLRLKSFDIRDAHGKFSKKFEFSFTSFEIYTVVLQNVLSDQKFAKFLNFAWINIYKLPLRNNSATQTFVNTRILFVSILPIICSFQQEYLT